MATHGSVLVLLLLCVGSVPAQEKKPDPKPKEIDKTTIERWDKRGYDHFSEAWIPPSGPRALSVFRRDDNDKKSKGLVPGFSMRQPDTDKDPPNSAYGPPPDPGVPFALVVRTPGADLSRLVDLDNLVSLSVDNLTARNFRRGPSLEDKHLEYIAELQGLTHLTLDENNKIYGPGIKHLASLKKLTYLDLSRTSVAGKWLRHLEGLLALETLVLEMIGGHFLGDDGGDLTDDGLKSLKELRQLKHLSLSRNLRLTDDGLKHLSGLENLVALDLERKDHWHTRFSDDGLKHLSGLRKLTHLNLTGTAVTDAGLKELAALKNLQVLILRDTKVKGAGLKELATLDNLTWLDLGRAEVTGAGLKELATLKNLTALSLHVTKLTDAGLKELATLKNLTSLSMSGKEVTDARLKELATLKNLKLLHLFSTDVTDDGVKWLQKELPKCKIVK